MKAFLNLQAIHLQPHLKSMELHLSIMPRNGLDLFALFVILNTAPI